MLQNRGHSDESLAAAYSAIRGELGPWADAFGLRSRPTSHHVRGPVDATTFESGSARLSRFGPSILVTERRVDGTEEYWILRGGGGEPRLVRWGVVASRAPDCELVPAGS